MNSAAKRKIFQHSYLDEAAAIAHCRRGLANYKVPMRIFAIDDFPKTPSPNGFKIQRNKLRDMALERLGD